MTKKALLATITSVPAVVLWGLGISWWFTDFYTWYSVPIIIYAIVVGIVGWYHILKEIT